MEPVSISKFVFAGSFTTIVLLLLLQWYLFLASYSEQQKIFLLKKSGIPTGWSTIENFKQKFKAALKWKKYILLNIMIRFRKNNIWMQMLFLRNLIINSMYFFHLTRLTRLIHTSFLPSKWNLYPKIQFWSKNDGEKWSRKIYFEIPPCGKMVIFITEFVIKDTFMK